MASEESPSRSHHRWIAFGMWLALLAATLMTSKFAISPVTTGGYLWQLWTQFASSQYAPSGASTGSPTATAMAIVGSVLALTAIVLILIAWLKFAWLSQELIVSYAWLEQQEEESTIFSDLLKLPETGDQGIEGADEPDLDQAEGTLVSDIVRYLAFAWAVLLVIPPAMVVVGTLF